MMNAMNKGKPNRAGILSLKYANLSVWISILLLSYFSPGDAPECVLTNERGGFIDLDNWRKRIFNKALKKAGLRRIRIHDLRHTY
jgi:integrase